MTIYKFSNVEKKPVKKDELLDVVTIPLNESEETPAPRSPAYIFVRPRRSRACANVIVVFLALVVLAAGIIGGIYLYKHLVHKATYGVCGVRYFEEEDYAAKSNAQPHSEFRYMEEKVEVTDDKVEKIEVPQFDECEKSLVLHDFESNFTAIVDKDKFRCFVMKLNRTLVAPPKDMVDLIWKLRSGYYMPDAMIVRRKYRVMMPALQDLTKYGPYIQAECNELKTFRLEHLVGGRNIWKRSVGKVAEKRGENYTYGFFGGQQADGSVSIAKIELLDHVF